MEALASPSGKHPHLSDAAATFVVDLAQAFGRVQLNVLCGSGLDILIYRRALCVCFVAALHMPEECSSKMR